MTDRDSSGAYRDDLAAAQARIAALEEKIATREDGEGGDGSEHDDPGIAELAQQREHLARIVATGEPGAGDKRGAAVLATMCSIPMSFLLRRILLSVLWDVVCWLRGWSVYGSGTMEDVAYQRAQLDRMSVGFPGVWWMWVAAAVVMAAAIYFMLLSSIRNGAVSKLQQLDARIVEARREQDERRDEARRKRDEARRLQTIERELVALREAREKATESERGAPHARIEVDDEIEIEVDAEVEEARAALSLARRR